MIMSLRDAVCFILSRRKNNESGRAGFKGMKKVLSDDLLKGLFWGWQKRKNLV